MTAAPDLEPRAVPFRISRRLHHRFVMVMRDAILHSGVERAPCVVRNISDGGLMARVYRPVELGEAVSVEIADGRRLPGTVIWAQDWNVGIAFAEPIEVAGLLAVPWGGEDGEERRSDRRTRVECPAKLRVKGRFYFGLLNDISPNGARVRTHGSLKRVGEAVLILPDLPPLTASIQWVKGHDCGLRFREPIPAEALGGWLLDRGFADPDEAGAKDRRAD